MPALVLLVVAGIGLRAFLMASYVPAAFNNNDSVVYLNSAQNGLFSDAIRPAGYPLFLKASHFISNDIEFTVALQHLLGVATAVLLYLTVRRLGGARWLALIPAGVVLLSGDQLYLEHSLLAESIFTFLAVASIYAAVRTTGPENTIPWALLAGITLGAAVWVRTLGTLLIPLLVLWILFGTRFVGRVSWHRALATSGVALAGAGLLVFGYAGANALSHGGSFGLTQAGGWALYARVAQFADCTKFTPPASTARLCETAPTQDRPGPDYYGWVDGSPARAVFGGPPNGTSKLGAFAKQAILHQPLDYLRVVTKDMVRYIDSSFGFDRPYSGTGTDAIDLNRRAPDVEKATVAQVDRSYDHVRMNVNTGDVSALHDYQSVMRLHGVLIAALAMLSAVGLFAACGRPRWGILLLGFFAFMMYLVPAATAEYTARYGIPPSGLMAASGALGAWAIFERVRARRPLLSIRTARQRRQQGLAS